MKTSLKQKIRDYLESQYPNFVHKGEIGRKAVLEWGYENENAGRRCRELFDNNEIDRDYNNKGEVMYRAKDFNASDYDTLITNDDNYFNVKNIKEIVLKPIDYREVIKNNPQMYGQYQ